MNNEPPYDDAPLTQAEEDLLDRVLPKGPDLRFTPDWKRRFLDSVAAPGGGFTDPVGEGGVEISTVVSFDEFKGRRRPSSRFLFAAASVILVGVLAGALLSSNTTKDTVTYTDAPSEPVDDDPDTIDSEELVEIDPSNEPEPEAVAPPPEACFATSLRSTLESDETVTFENCSSGATSYLWSFSDGSTSTSESPSKSWETGSYTATLSATGPGGQDTATTRIEVAGTAANLQPPSGIRCQFSNFRYEDTIWTWSETWTWEVLSELTYEVVLNEDGQTRTVDVGAQGSYTTDPVTGQSNQGLSLKALRAISDDGAFSERGVTNCGAEDGQGWMPPD